MDMGKVHGHGESTWTSGQYMDMGNVHGHQASTWTWGQYMDMGKVHGASTWTLCSTWTYGLDTDMGPADGHGTWTCTLDMGPEHSNHPRGGGSNSYSPHDKDSTETDRLPHQR